MPCGSVQLRGIHIIVDSAAKRPKFVISLLGGAVIKLQAESVDMRNRWVELLRQKATEAAEPPVGLLSVSH